MPSPSKEAGLPSCVKFRGEAVPSVAGVRPPTLLLLTPRPKLGVLMLPVLLVPARPPRVPGRRPPAPGMGEENILPPPWAKDVCSAWFLDGVGCDFGVVTMIAAGVVGLAVVEEVWAFLCPAPPATPPPPTAPAMKPNGYEDSPPSVVGVARFLSSLSFPFLSSPLLLQALFSFSKNELKHPAYDPSLKPARMQAYSYARLTVRKTKTRD